MSLPRRNIRQFLGLLALSSLVLSALACAAWRVGLTWDESTYFSYATALKESIGSGSILSDIRLDPRLSYLLNPHPALMKWPTAYLAPLLEPLIGFLPAWRLSWELFVSVELVISLALIRSRAGTKAAMLFLVGLIGMPRFWTYLSLGIQDGVVALSWVNLALLSKDLLERPTRKRWLLFVALACVASGAKITGWIGILPPILLFLWSRRWKSAAMVACTAFAATIFVVVTTPNFWTPEFYRAPLAFVLYPVLREQIPIPLYYLGRCYTSHAPWHWGPAILGATAPLASAFLLALGCAAPLLHRSTRWLLPSYAFWWMVLVTPSVPRHDDIRQFLPAIALFLLGSTLLVMPILDGILKGRFQRISFLVPAALIASGIQAWMSAGPFPLSYFSPAVGNLSGAVAKGFDITLYMEPTTPELLDFINRELPRNARLAQLPLWSLNLEVLKEHGLLREDIRIVDLGSEGPDPDYFLFFHRRSVIPENAYNSGRLLADLQYQGISFARLVRGEPSLRFVLKPHKSALPSGAGAAR